MVATGNGLGSSAPPAESETDLRLLIPKLGLREYWYPAIRDREVGWKKPVFLKILGEDLCLFRGQSGQVAALANACPHRGAMLARGDCTFQGMVTCFYHGFTFDERGECVAALGEGPESPMPGEVRARVYPTVTLKDVVFVWMGLGEPAPLEESLPDEFFDPDAQVFNWVTIWPCNWRPSLENVADSHFRYLHRNSVRMLMRPIARPSFPLRGRPTRIGEHRLRSVAQADATPPGTSGPRGGAQRAYQDYYPGVDAKWPQHRWRLLWTWMFAWAEKRRLKRRYDLSEEWGPGQHLPSIFRQNYWTHIYSRWVVPIAENESRIWYFHAAKQGSWLGRLYERLHWTFIHNWMVNRNFSEQDARGAIEAYHDTGETLAPTDVQTIAWRKFLLTARGLEPPQPGTAVSAEAQRAAEPVAQPALRARVAEPDADAPLVRLRSENAVGLFQL